MTHSSIYKYVVSYRPDCLHSRSHILLREFVEVLYIHFIHKINKHLTIFGLFIYLEYQFGVSCLPEQSLHSMYSYNPLYIFHYSFSLLFYLLSFIPLPETLSPSSLTHKSHFHNQNIVTYGVISCISFFFVVFPGNFFCIFHPLSPVY